ncbi:flavodoxin-dependent (E)-4-hydroxy-3-methylbut-2-enyl-diphosphate synthase [Planctomycetota bacterium]
MSPKTRKTNTIMVGPVPVGGRHPVVIQSMTNTPTHDVPATLKQIRKLARAGCEIVRCAVPDNRAAKALKTIVSKSPLPVVADVHFRAALAVRAIEAGVAKVRINPGNIGGKAEILKVIRAARKAGIPIRIGVNSGSLEKDLLRKYKRPTPAALAASMLRWVKYFEGKDFTGLILSVKSASLEDTITVNRKLSAKLDYPLHIGITEAGTRRYGTVKSAIGLGVLLREGIGDTIRVSLSGDPVHEITAAQDILKALGLRRFGPEIITCPTCGRTRMQVEKIALEVEKQTRTLDLDIAIAVMGCEVNGPGEAAEADIGIACGNDKAALFVKGKKIRSIPAGRVVSELLSEIKNRFLT